MKKHYTFSTAYEGRRGGGNSDQGDVQNALLLLIVQLHYFHGTEMRGKFYKGYRKGLNLYAYKK